jgi:hypothetical protein
VLTIAALLMAAATAASPSSSALVSTASWWEKVTVTVSGDGKPQSCKYESSLRASDPASCDVEGGSLGASGSGSKEEFTRITFERRFIPGGQLPDESSLQLGDTLLGRHVMALAIDPSGSVQGCKVVASSGDMPPDYGCEEVQAEKFEASAAKAAASPPRQGYMTVLVYGHAEHLA